jgi:hypothetical protein
MATKGTLERLAKIERLAYAEAHIHIKSGQAHTAMSSIDRRSARKTPRIRLGRARLVRQRSAGSKHILDPSMEVAGCALALETFSIARAMLAFDPVGLANGDPELEQRCAAHGDGAFKRLSLNQRKVESIELHELDAVVHPEHNHRLGEGFEYGFHARTGHFPSVLAEQDRLGGLGSSGPKQVEAGAVAIIDLGSEFLAELDLGRLAVDDRHRDALGLEHLRNRLPNRPYPTTMALVSGEPSPSRCSLASSRFEPVCQPHQESVAAIDRVDRTERDDASAESVRGRGLRKQHEAEFARLAEQAEPDTAWPAIAEHPRKRNQHHLYQNHRGDPQDEQRPLGDDRQVQQHSDRRKNSPRKIDRTARRRSAHAGRTIPRA